MPFSSPKLPFQLETSYFNQNDTIYFATLAFFEIKFGTCYFVNLLFLCFSIKMILFFSPFTISDTIKYARYSQTAK